MRLGIFAKTFDATDPLTVLTEVRAAGFASVQYNMVCSGLESMPAVIAPEAVAAVAAAARETGLAVCAISGTYNMAHPDPKVRARGLRRLEVLASASSAMGCGLITLCTGTRDPIDQWSFHRDNSGAEAWRDLVLEMEKAMHVAERFGLRLGIEPERANIVDSAARARRLIDEIGSPALSVVIDPANLFERVGLAEQHKIIAGAIDLLGDRIALAHAKDRTATGVVTAVGTGVLDFSWYIERLRAIGFAGDIVTHGLRASEASAVARFLSGLLP
jgi:sugar phosphate isomerase/epimerase